MNLDKRTMLSAFPENLSLFDEAVDKTLYLIHQEAAAAWRRPGPVPARRILSWGLALLLVLAGALGIAEGVRRGVFDFLFAPQAVLPEAADLARTDTAVLRAGETEIRITESVFDGTTLRFVMSVRCLNVDQPLTEEDLWDPEGAYLRQLEQDGVTALGSFDWFTVEGQRHTMTSGSGGTIAVGEEAGEALCYFELKVLSEDAPQILLPEGDFTVGVPVLRYAMRGDTEGLSPEEAQIQMPVTRVPLDSIRDMTPVTELPMGKGTLTVLEARMSPIRMYTTLRVDFDDEVAAEDAKPYIEAWADYVPVDENGGILGSGSVWGWGLPMGEEDAQRHLWMQGEFEPIEGNPQKVYLAPVGWYGENGDWGVDMEKAVELIWENGG